uniref:Histidinol-phosphate transaminase n=1 Tax=Roseihalotalea indica TaxID=2867963 RepID=A0AA49JK00_9BACT|nr:histidinol-phosphate transaminase [Tunicatimonas sp. TK19036]
MNRRNWLKSSALLAGGLSLGSAFKANFAQASNRVAARLYAPYDDEAAMIMARPELKARLLANENPFGPSKAAREALIGELDTSFRYGFDNSMKFAKLLAERYGLTEMEESMWGMSRPKQVMLGAGSTELLMAASVVYGQNGGKILSADPTYMSLVRSAQDVGAEWDTVPLTKDFVHDLDRLADAVSDEHSLVYLCNPNNPTATTCDPDELRAFCKEVSKKKPIFIDEAYIDYTPDPDKYSMADLVAEGYNVIVTRTFSKLHAFAGLRIGYSLAQPDVIEQMSKYSNGAGNISSPSMAAALASFQDEEYQTYAKEMNQKSKDFLYKTLEDAGYEYIPSHTNFVLFPVRMDSKRFTQEMMKRGVGVRPWSFYNQEWCRVSIGTMEDMEYFASAFSELS